MGRRHYSDEIERTAMVVYLPQLKLFWTGRRGRPDRLRNAKVFYFDLPLPPPGGVYMRRLRARKMCSLDHHQHFLRYLQEEDREFYLEQLQRERQGPAAAPRLCSSCGQPGSG